MALIKKKDVKNYFAARRARHPLFAKSVKPHDATDELKRDSQGTSGDATRGPDVPKSS